MLGVGKEGGRGVVDEDETGRTDDETLGSERSSEDEDERDVRSGSLGGLFGRFLVDAIDCVDERGVGSDGLLKRVVRTFGKVPAAEVPDGGGRDGCTERVDDASECSNCTTDERPSGAFKSDDFCPAVVCIRETGKEGGCRGEAVAAAWTV